jgi:hypothetical protein
MSLENAAKRSCCTSARALLKARHMRFLLSCFLFLAGCAPISQYRYSGMTPAPRPIAWDGYPSHAGELHGDVSVTHTEVAENLLPELHDSALHVAATTIEGNASITPVRGLDIGVRWSYADYSWTQETAVGTMPLPKNPSLFGIGPEIRGALFLDHEKHFALGIAASVLVYQVPWAAYTLGSGTSYTLVKTGSDSDWTLAAGIYPSYSFGPDGRYGTAFGVLGIHSSFKNDGFTDTPSNGSSITEDGFVPYAGFGYGIHTPYFHASAMLYMPVTIDSTTFGPGGMITLGFDLPLWTPSTNHQRAVEREDAPGAFAYHP